MAPWQPCISPQRPQGQSLSAVWSGAQQDALQLLLNWKEIHALWEATMRQFLIHLLIWWELPTRPFPIYLPHSSCAQNFHLMPLVCRAQLQASVSIKPLGCNLGMARLGQNDPSLVPPVFWPLPPVQCHPVWDQGGRELTPCWSCFHCLRNTRLNPPELVVSSVAKCMKVLVTQRRKCSCSHDPAAWGPPDHVSQLKVAFNDNYLLLSVRQLCAGTSLSCLKEWKGAPSITIKQLSNLKVENKWARLIPQHFSLSNILIKLASGWQKLESSNNPGPASDVWWQHGVTESEVCWVVAVDFGETHKRKSTHYLMSKGTICDVLYVCHFWWTRNMYHMDE